MSDAKNTDNVSMGPACAKEASMENTVPLMLVDRVAMIMECVKTWPRGTKTVQITSKFSCLKKYYISCN